MAEVFISYAHADDQLLAEGAKGWVTALADRLQKSLAMRPGGAQTAVWMDHRLEPQKQVDAALAARVARADCFVAVLSPRYLESDWCRSEIDRFVTRVGEDAGRVFLVEMAPTERERWPVRLRNLSAMQFWSRSFDDPAAMPFGWPAPDPAGDRPYWRALNELSHFVSEQLQSVGRANGSTGQRRVWIADPTDHVLDVWERLAGALRQHGCVVVPQSPGAYPVANETEYLSALRADLVTADLFVQVLGPSAGRRPPWGDTAYTVMQANAARSTARERAVPLEVWRSADVRLDAIADQRYAELLIGAAANGFEEFQQQVLARAVAASPPATASAPLSTDPTTPANADTPLSVCVSADAPDRSLGQQVRDTLFDLGADASLAPEPAPDQPPSLWRRDYEAMLAESHGVVIVYGSTPPSWVQAQVQAARKLLARSRRGTWGALLDGPPGQQPDHGVRSHNVMMLDCRSGALAEPLSRFLSVLRTSSDAGAARA